MLSSCMEHILTKDALYLLSYISIRRDNGSILPHHGENCKHKFCNFCFFYGTAHWFRHGGRQEREEGALCGGGPCAVGECIFFV